MRATIVILLTTLCLGLNAQTRQELEEQRKKTLEEITYVDNMIKETEKAKTSGLNDLRVIGSRLSMRENVISGIQEEINLIGGRIELNTLAVTLMEKDLKILRDEYEHAVISSYKNGKGNPEISFILSARDFNQGYKRLKYLQQMTKFRRRQAEIIMELKIQIESTQAKLREDLDNVSVLKSKEEDQKKLLQQEQDRKRRLVNTLGSRERQLRRDLDEKKRIAGRIESEIARMIEEERAKSVSSEMTPEMKLIGSDFAQNKGRLPWPVEKGVITSQFGLRNHPVLANVKDNNIGIDITSLNKTIVRAVFKGQVVRVFAIPGANMNIIMRHGKFLTVYQNLVNVKVKQGDMVDTKQEIGEVYCDLENGSKSILKFMVFEEMEKNDPEIWLAKRQ